MEVLFLHPYQLGGGPTDMLSLKHCSGPVDPKFKFFFSPPVKGAQSQMSLGQKPKYKVFFLWKPPLTVEVGV